MHSVLYCYFRVQYSIHSEYYHNLLILYLYYYHALRDEHDGSVPPHITGQCRWFLSYRWLVDGSLLLGLPCLSSTWHLLLYAHHESPPLTSCHVMSRYVMSCDVMSRYVMSYHVRHHTSYRIISRIKSYYDVYVLPLPP